MTEFSHSYQISSYETYKAENSVIETSQLSSLDITNLLPYIPQTRYYGSKRRLLTWIYESIKDLNFQSVLDGFGGTASVSLLFKAMGKQVTFNDALKSNAISAKALLTNHHPIDIKQAHDFIDAIKPEKGFISVTFENMYYTDEENSWLDGAVKKINKIEDELERSIYLYCLFQACLMKRPFNLFHRANLNLRTNKNITRTFGNYVTWESEFQKLMKARLSDVFKLQNQAQCIVNILNEDVTKIKPSYDLVYLDPPYVSKKNNSDGYLKRYHFLEGLSNYDIWIDSLDKDSTIKAVNTSPYMKDWENRNTFKEKLFDLIKKHNKSIVVLSYIKDGYPSIEDIEKCFENNFKSVKVLKKEFSHALAKEKKIELLFIGRNN